jgi:hypothetical protein
MTTETFFGKRENKDISDKQALIQSLIYMFDRTDAQHGCILTFLHKEEIKRVLIDFIAEVKDEDTHIRVIGDNNRIADIFSFEYFINIGVSIQKTLQGLRFDYLNIIGSERVSGIKSKVAVECLRRFEYLI